VLSALAGVLRLSPAERVHLQRLAKAGSPGFTCRGGADGPARTVRATVRAVIDQLEPAAAVLLDQRGDLLAWTGGFHRLTAPLGLLDGDQPNLPRFVLADPRARQVFPDWGARRRRAGGSG
jgi:hypothetical protein